MKAYTDLNQSKKLAEILPPESADTCFVNDGTSIKIDANPYNVRKLIWKDYVVEVIPCWSLAALIEIIRKPTAFDLLIDGRGCRCHCRDKQEGKFYGTDDYCDTPVDACIEIILKLHERKLL